MDRAERCKAEHSRAEERLGEKEGRKDGRQQVREETGNDGNRLRAREA